MALKMRDVNAGSLSEMLGEDAASARRDESTLADACREVQALVETIWRLRQPDGCPWDRE